MKLSQLLRKRRTRRHQGNHSASWNIETLEGRVLMSAFVPSLGLANPVYDGPTITVDLVPGEHNPNEDYHQNSNTTSVSDGPTGGGGGPGDPEMTRNFNSSKSNTGLSSQPSIDWGGDDVRFRSAAAGRKADGDGGSSASRGHDLQTAAHEATHLVQQRTSEDGGPGGEDTYIKVIESMQETVRNIPAPLDGDPNRPVISGRPPSRVFVAVDEGIVNVRPLETNKSASAAVDHNSSRSNRGTVIGPDDSGGDPDRPIVVGSVDDGANAYDNDADNSAAVDEGQSGDKLHTAAHEAAHVVQQRAGVVVLDRDVAGREEHYGQIPLDSLVIGDHNLSGQEHFELEKQTSDRLTSSYDGGGGAVDHNSTRSNNGIVGDGGDELTISYSEYKLLPITIGGLAGDNGTHDTAMAVIRKMGGGVT